MKAAMETLEAYLDRKHEELTLLNGFLGTPLALRHPATKIAPGSGSLVGDGDFGVCSTITGAKLDALATLRASRRHL